MSRFPAVRILFAGLCLFGLAGCESSEPVAEEPPIPMMDDEPAASPPASDDDAGSGLRVEEISGVTFRVPASWKRAELTPAQAGFIDARFLIPVDGEEVQLTVTSARGGIDANFERWEGQFVAGSGPPAIRESIRVDGADAEWIDLRGTFTAGAGFSGGAPQEGARMLGVGIPLGDSEMYLKLTGLAAQVETLVEPLRAMATSADLP